MEEVIVALKADVEVRVIGSTCLVREFSYDFTGINLEDWMVRFFRNVYRVDDSTANGLIDALWMNWARDRSKLDTKLPQSGK